MSLNFWKRIYFIFRTVIRFLSRGSLMYSEFWLLFEGSITFIIFIGFLSCLNSLINNEIWFLEESFITFIAFTGFSISFPVWALWRNMRYDFQEKTTTYSTSIRFFFSCMNSLMSTETQLKGKGSAISFLHKFSLLYEFFDVYTVLIPLWRFSHIQNIYNVFLLCEFSDV